MEHINLIRKIAWSFSTSTGLEFEDLFQEAALAYCEALKTFKQEAHEWYGDQLAIKFISDKNQYKVLELPCDEYNYTPGSKEERKDVYVYHFKGQRKDWMMNGQY